MGLAQSGWVGEGVGPHQGAAVHLPEPLGGQLGQPLLERGADSPVAWQGSQSE